MTRMTSDAPATGSVPLPASFTASELVWDSRVLKLYRAQDRSLGRPVLITAARQATPGARRQLEAQFAICSHLDGVEAVPKPITARIDTEPAFLVLSDARGEPLDRWLAGQPSARLTDPSQWLRLMIRLAAAVEAVHERTVVIKGLSASNVLYDPNHGVTLTDFCQATLLPREFQDVVSVRALEGDPRYLAPEQTGRMNRSVDLRCDLYALGCIAYQLLVGAPPFDGDDLLQVVHAHLARPAVIPTPIRERLPELVCDVTDRLLTKEPADRYQSARNLRLDLERCLADWQRERVYPRFELDQAGRAARLQLGGHLVGREQERATLCAALDACAAQSGLVLLEGLSGVGKSALVQELALPLGQRGGFMAQGKFEQYNVDVPFRGLARVLRNLFRWLLQMPADEYSLIREALCDALGDDAAALTEIEPELARVLDVSAGSTSLTPAESMARQARAIRVLFASVASAERPLVLLLDDAQWSDPDSLRLVGRLLEARSIQNLLVVLCARPTQPASRNLDELLETVRRAGAPVTRLRLEPLDRGAMEDLVRDALSQQETDPALLDLLWRYSAGNPFALLEALESLVEDAVLRIDPQRQQWSYAAEEGAARLLRQEDVAALVRERLTGLPDGVTQLVCAGSVIGGRFSASRLAALLDENPDTVLAGLRRASQAGILDAVRTVRGIGGGDTAAPELAQIDLSFVFRHDRIQEAAYGLLDDDRRARLHRRVGELLRAEAAADRLDETLLQIVGHLNRAPPRTADEALDLAHLNARAARRAQETNSWSIAAQCASTGLRLLGDEAWKRHAELALELNTQLAESAALTGQLATLETATHAVIGKAPARDRLRAQKALILGYALQGRLMEAIYACREGLRWFGVDMPLDPDESQIHQAFVAAMNAIGDRDPMVLARLPAVQDPDQRAILELYGTLIAVAYIVSQPLFAWMILTAVARSVRHGNSPAAPFFYACTGISLLAITRDVPRAERFAQLALALAEDAPDKAAAGRALFVVGSTVSHFSHPYNYSLDLLRRARKLLIAAGELEFAGYASYNLCQGKLLSGRPLGELEPLMARHVDELEALRVTTSRRWSAIVLQLLRNLTGKGSEAGSSLLGDLFGAEDLRAVQKAEDHTALAIYHVNALIQALLFEDGERAVRLIEPGRRFIHGIGEFPGGVLFPFLEAYCVLRYGPQQPLQAADVEAIVADRLARLRWQADANPGLFMARLHIVQGMEEMAAGHRAAALDTLEAGLRAARDGGLRLEESLALLAAADVARRWDKPGLARDYEREARTALSLWGADAVSRRIGQHRNDDDVEPADSSLDFQSLLKLSAVFDSALPVDELPARVLSLVLENAGATFGALVYRRGNGWLARQRSSDGGDDDEAKALDACHSLPLAVINQVLNAREMVRLDGSEQLEVLSSDPVLQERKVRSVLCLPLVYGKQLTGALYLENRLLSGAFPPRRIDGLSILCAQAAISLENALLFAELGENKARLQAIVDNNIDIICLIDRDLKYAFTSPSVQQILGYDSKALVGMPVVDPIHPDDQAAAHEYLQRMLVSPGHEETIQIRFRHANGSWRDIEAAGRSLFDVPGVDALVVNTRDISERKRADNALRLLNEELETRVERRTEALQRLNQELQSFSYSVSHDLRAPLRHVAGFSAALAEEYGAALDDAARAYLDRIQSGVGRMGQLIDDMLVLSRVSSIELRRERVDLSAQAGDVLAQLREEEPERRVEATVQPGLVAVGDPSLLRIALENLLSNAWKYSSKREQSRIEFGRRRQDGQDVYYIRDNGAGFDMDNYDRLFGPFQRLHSPSEFPGTGIGLATAQRAVHRHDGSLWADSVVDEGATFYFTLGQDQPQSVE